VLESAEKPLTGSEIREMLSGVVSEAQWSSWWTAARKHPQVVASTGGRQAYRWEASTAGAVASIRTTFDRAKPAEQLELFRKHAGRDAALAATMAARIAAAAGEKSASEPAFAFEAWSVLERANRIPDGAGWSPERLLAPGADVRALLAGLEDRQLRERALEKLREIREDWPALYRDQVLRESDPRVLDLLTDALEAQKDEQLPRLLDAILSQPRKYPAGFVWLAERAAEDEALRSRSPLRLLQQILASISSADFSSVRPRLRALMESGGTVPRLFAHLTEEQAVPALETIDKTPALDAFHREPLRNAILLRYPSLREETHQTLYATADAIAEKQREVKRLAEVEIPSNRKAIEEARAMGDLRENFEYKSARERHEYLNARLAKLHRDLGRVRPIDLGSLELSEVRIGSQVELRSKGGGSRTFTVLGPWESSPERGILSYESELGAQLLGRRLGDEVRFADERFEVVRIAAAAARGAVTP
jgi:transcription elongation GreA/GreB family factor